ncbi:hypothetical protein BDN72DRAFT_863693 [Pluteus cervinus]|uniref:Uncharacterized protein n=1 Tax=Pluteus cervinus TaxID=181527 RepID=A0ACD3A7E7_9AGAR|nr:hypothetical protein BDN72DRAFT_863693 [Pluteus cervinus]
MPSCQAFTLLPQTTMNSRALESIIHAQFSNMKPSCMFLKADRCSVKAGATEKEFVPGQLYAYPHPFSSAVLIDEKCPASQETFVVVEWLFEKEDLACLNDLCGPVKSRQELQNLLGPRELLRTNATDCIPSSYLEDHLTVHKYLDTSLDFPVGLYQNCWYYRMELQFIGRPFSSANLKGYNVTCTAECSSIYSTYSGRQRYCLHCKAWFHERCMRYASSQSSNTEHDLSAALLNIPLVRGYVSSPIREPWWMCFGTGTTYFKLQMYSLMNHSKVPTPVLRHFPEVEGRAQGSEAVTSLVSRHRNPGSLDTTHKPDDTNYSPTPSCAASIAPNPTLLASPVPSS